MREPFGGACLQLPVYPTVGLKPTLPAALSPMCEVFPFCYPVPPAFMRTVKTMSSYSIQI